MASVKQKKPLPFLHVQTKLVYANATVKSCTMEKKNNDLTEIIAQALNEMKSDLGDKFDPENINLAELQRRTGISRARLRRIKADSFIDKPHGLIGRKAETTVLSGFTGVLDALLMDGVTNSTVCFDRLKENG